MFPEKPEPIVVEALDTAKPRVSNSIRMAAFGDTLAIAQEVQTSYDDSEAWVALSRDGGKTWRSKAVYSAGALREPAIAFAPDGTLAMAGSSRTKDKARPWLVCSSITDQ